MNWVKQWEAVEPGLPKGQGKFAAKGKGKNKGKNQYSQSNSSSPKGGGKNPNKRFKVDSSNRLQAVEQLARSTATLAQKTARQVAQLFSWAVITVLCPVLLALRQAAAVTSDESEDSLEVIFQRWGCLCKALSTDAKTAEPNKAILKKHVDKSTSSDCLKGKVLLCKVKPSYRDGDLYVVQLRVNDELSEVATAIIDTLVSAGGTVSFHPASRSGEERQVEHDTAVLDSCW